MKTDDLIQALAADTTPATAVSGRLARAMPLALMLPFAAVLAFWQARPDLVEALTSFAVYKTLVPGLLTLAALWLGLSLTRPEARPRRQATVLGVILAVVVVLLCYALATTTRAEIALSLDTPDYVNCLFSVPLLAALPMAATLWAMRSGAARRPVVAGALAGLAAGGIGAAAYSLHCPHDALMYFYAGYGVAIAVVTGIGALIGWKALRW